MANFIGNLQDSPGKEIQQITKRNVELEKQIKGGNTQIIFGAVLWFEHSLLPLKIQLINQ